MATTARPPSPRRSERVLSAASAVTLLLAIAFGAVIGVVLGLVGGGGSILAVPVFIYVLSEPVADATTASLLVVVMSAGVAALSSRYRRRIDVPIAAAMTAIGAIGAIAGTALNRGSRPGVIVLVLSAVMLGAAVAMLRHPTPSGHARPARRRPAQWRRLIPAAVGIGLLTGYVGVGGGFLIVPALTLILGLEIDRAIATSLAIITLTSAVGLVAHLQSGTVNWAVALPFGAAAVAGSLTGARVSTRTSPARLTQLFAGVIIVVAVALAGAAVAGRA